MSTKNLFEKMLLLSVVINLFDGNVNTTNDVGLSDEMRTYYSDYLIDLAEPELVHDQFAQKHPIPKNGGKEIEFRKYDSLPKALTPLVEGVTPKGQKMSMNTIRAIVSQYGGFIELSDMLLLTAVDNNLVQASKLLASQAGRTLDTITREVLNGGTNVQYANGVSDRTKLVGGADEGNCYLNIVEVRKAVRTLKVMNAKRINGSYVAIIHPDCSFDLMEDPRWIAVKSYSDPEGIYEGEIGKIENTRFVETSEAKIFHAEDLSENHRNLTVKTGATSDKITVAEAISEAEAQVLAGRWVIISGEVYEVSSATAGTAGNASVTLTESVTVAADAVIYPGEAGAEGRDVYSTLIMGADAYGVTEITGGGLEFIVKQLGSAGTGDPLNQRATAGWKATKVAERLVEQYIVRVETVSTFNDIGAN